MERRIPVIGIIGLGLIGGSVGLALRAHGGWRVTGFDPLKEVRAGAVELGACDAVAGSVEELSRNSDIVMVATPSSHIPEVGLLAAGYMKPGSILTDTGSVKSPLQNLIVEGLPPGVRYVGGHPMAGSEESGLWAASADLFRGATWALTTHGADRDSVEAIEAVVRAAGANPLVVDAGEHDLAVAFASHLPYLLAVTLALSVQAKGRDLALVDRLLASGFRDSTRLARSDPSVAMDYCAVNREAVLDALTAFEKGLRSIKEALREGRSRELAGEAGRAREYLNRLARKGWMGNGHLV